MIANGIIVQKSTIAVGTNDYSISFKKSNDYKAYSCFIRHRLQIEI